MSLGLILAGSVSGGFSQSSKRVASEDFVVEKDIVFLEEGRPEKMDAYLPSEKFARPLPAVIVIHGGAWIKGDKGDGREVNVCKTLAANGYAAFSINYQLGDSGKSNTDPAKSPTDGTQPTPAAAPWPQNFYDCKSALRFVRSQASKFGIDPSRIGIWGGSAGAHLAMITGATANDPAMNQGGLYLDQDNGVSCILDFYGPIKVQGTAWARRFAGATPEESEANYQAAAVATHLDKDTPPILIVHGNADTVVDISHSRELIALLEELGVEFQFVEVQGAKHAFHFEPKEMDLRPVVLEFLGKHLGNPSPVSGEATTR